MNKPFRPRNLYLILGSIIILIYLLVTDPNPGHGSTLVFLATLGTPVVAVMFAHFARKALFDYLMMGDLYRKAKESPTGAGLIFLGICIVMFGLLGLFGNQVNAQPVSTYVPPAAYQHIDTIKKEVATYDANRPKSISLLA